MERLLKGKAHLLYEDGKVYEGNMRKCCMTMQDILESLRQETQLEDLEKVKQIFMETTGRISLVLELKT